MAVQNVPACLPALYVFETYPTPGVQSATCKEANQVSSKIGGSIIIKGILGLSINPDTIPYQIVQQQTQVPETIVEPQTVYARENVEVENEVGGKLH